MKGFGFWTGWFVVLASMIGSGILTNSGVILKASGSYSGLLFVWVVGGILAVAGALTLAELSSGMPKAGGDYAYVREAFGNAWGFVYGWAMVVVGFAAPIALVAYTIANYLYPTLAPLYASAGITWGERTFVISLASTLIIVFTLSHSLGHRSSSTVQIITTLFNILLLLALPVSLLFCEARPFTNVAHGQPMGASSWIDWGSHLILVLYAYTGWNAAAYLSGEMRNPRRNLPLAITLGCLAVMVVYLLVNLFYEAALPPDRLATLTDGQWERLAEVSVGQLFGSHTAKVFSLLVSVGILAALSAFILTGPRIVYAMANDGLFPKIAGDLHPKTQVPVVAIMIQGALALIFLWTGSFEQVLNLAGYGLAVVGMLTVSPIFVLRKRPDFHPAFRVPGYPFTPILFLGVSAASLVASFIKQPGSSSLSIALMAAGFPIYYLLRGRLVRLARPSA